MARGLGDWAEFGSLREAHLEQDARDLLEESLRAPVPRERVDELLDLYAESYRTLPPHIRKLVGRIEVAD